MKEEKIPTVEIVCGNYFEPLCHVGCTWCQNYAYICEGMILRGECPWGRFETEEEIQKIKEVRFLMQKYNNFEVLKYYGYETDDFDFSDISDPERLQELKSSLEKAKGTALEEMKEYVEKEFSSYQDEEIDSYFKSLTSEETKQDEEEHIVEVDSDEDLDDLPF